MSDHPVDMLDMLQVDKEVFVQHVTQHVIHHGLEHCKGLVKPKMHDQVHKMTKGNVEGCSQLVSITYSDQVKGIPQVEFEENSDLM